MADNFTQFGFDEPTPRTGPEPTRALLVELVPAGSWGANLRSALSTTDWDKLRRESYRKAGHRCEICGGKGHKHPVECHEVWEYDDDRKIQTLIRLISLCPACHEVKHYGLAERRGRAGYAFRHLMTVNGWSKEATTEHLLAAFEQWSQRSHVTWTLDLSWLDNQSIEVNRE